MNKEIRCVADCELRATRRGRTIEGMPIVFDKISNDLGGFREIIKPEAVDGVLDSSDILLLMNHDENRGILARYTNGQGTMDVLKERTGVKMTTESPDTPLGDEAISGVRRGDIRSMSFAFTIADGGDKWEKQPDGTYLRTITKFNQLYDFSLVYRPAYSDTSVAVRSLVDVKTKESEELRIEAEKAAAEERKRADDLAEELRKKESSPSDATNPVNSNPVTIPAEVLTEYFKNLFNQIPKK